MNRERATTCTIPQLRIQTPQHSSIYLPKTKVQPNGRTGFSSKTGIPCRHKSPQTVDGLVVFLTCRGCFLAEEGVPDVPADAAQHDQTRDTPRNDDPHPEAVELPVDEKIKHGISQVRQDEGGRRLTAVGACPRDRRRKPRK